MNFVPLNGRVLVKNYESNKTASGIVLPDSENNDVIKGVVESTGDILAYVTDEELRHISVGSIVWYDPLSAKKMEFNNEEYHVVDIVDIIGVEK